MDAKMFAPNLIDIEFCAHMTSVLKEWYCSLSPIKQDELHRLDNTDTIITALNHEFLGNHSLVQKEIRKEYFDMKYCSLKRSDLESYFKRIALLVKWL